MRLVSQWRWSVHTKISFWWWCSLHTVPVLWDRFNFSEIFLVSPGVSFTKLCDASYNQLIRRRSHELILHTNCYIALGCVARIALPCVTPRYVASCVGTQASGIRTRRMNIFVKDPWFCWDYKYSCLPHYLTSVWAIAFQQLILVVRLLLHYYVIMKADKESACCGQHSSILEWCQMNYYAACQKGDFLYHGN